MLNVQRLYSLATVPTVANSGEDIGYDLYSSMNYYVAPQEVAHISTGIAVEMDGKGGLICDRSSMGKKGLKVIGGVIDAGYRGEIIVMLANVTQVGQHVNAGEKIAQLIPGFTPVWEQDVLVLSELPASSRGISGFGSSGR